MSMPGEVGPILTDADLASMMDGLNITFGDRLCISGLTLSSGVWRPPYTLLASGVPGDVDELSSHPDADLLALMVDLSIGFMEYRRVTIAVDELGARGVVMRRDYRIGRALSGGEVYQVVDFAPDESQPVVQVYHCKRI